MPFSGRGFWTPLDAIVAAHFGEPPSSTLTGCLLGPNLRRNRPRSIAALKLRITGLNSSFKRRVRIGSGRASLGLGVVSLMPQSGVVVIGARQELLQLH